MRQQQLLGAINSQVEESVTGYKTVVAFGHENEIKDEFNRTGDELRTAGIKAEIFGGVMGPLMNIIGNVGFLLIVICGALFTMKGLIGITTIYVFIQYSKQFTRPINEVANQYTSILNAITGAERVFEIADQNDETDEGKKVLCLDTDPQGNLTFALTGGNAITSKAFANRSLYDMIDGFRYNTQTRDFIVESEYENVDLIPANDQTPRLSKRLEDLYTDAQRDYDRGDPKYLASDTDVLDYFLRQVKDEYDYILIDTQPSRDSLLLSNAIAAADYVLIPLKCDSFSEDSAFRTYVLCNEMRKSKTSRIKGVGVMLTMVQKSAASQDIRSDCRAKLGATLFNAEIAFGKSVDNSINRCVPVCYSARTQPPAKSYVAAYEELKKRLAELEEK